MDITPRQLAIGICDFLGELDRNFPADDAIHDIIEDIFRAPSWSAASREILNLLTAITSTEPLRRCDSCRGWYATLSLQRMHCDHCLSDDACDQNS